MSELPDASRQHELVAIDTPLAIDQLSWTMQDWHEFFEERAGIIEFDGGKPREQAEVMAFECCVAEWMHRHPVPSTPGQCLECGQPAQTDDQLELFETEGTDQVWLHKRCWSVWYAGRKASAAAALRSLSFQESGGHV